MNVKSLQHMWHKSDRFWAGREERTDLWDASHRDNGHCG